MLQDDRAESLFTWLNSFCIVQPQNFKLISGDASFRRYFRCTIEEQVYIAVDSPPSTENNALFCALAQSLTEHNVTVPQIIEQNLTEGFLLLSDLGKTHLGDELTLQNASTLYTAALNEITKARAIDSTSLGLIPAYDSQQVMLELEIFTEWLIKNQLGIHLNANETALIKSAFSYISAVFLQQPTQFVHRDYHSRNIMLTGSTQKIAVIDFQGALIGPVMYDAVSLLRDCYIMWPTSLVLTLSEQHRQQHYSNISAKNWQQGFDIVGLQRHLKAAGIFARLNQRDNKPFYMADIPRTLQYVIEVGKNYPELLDFSIWIETKILPQLSH